MNYVGDCPLFSRCEPGMCYDIGLVVGALNQITENEEYQILTEITFQKNCNFPTSNKRQCSLGILNTFPFLRYSPSTDGVYFVYCVLFSNCTQSKKYHTLPEIDWSNVRQTSRNHSKSPEHNAGKKASDHTLCEEQAANFIAVFEGKFKYCLSLTC